MHQAHPPRCSSLRPRLTPPTAPGIPSNVESADRALAADDIRYSAGLPTGDFRSTGAERILCLFAGKAAADHCPFGPLEASGVDESQGRSATRRRPTCACASASAPTMTVPSSVGARRSPAGEPAGVKVTLLLPRRRRLRRPKRTRRGFRSRTTAVMRAASAGIAAPTPHGLRPEVDVGCAWRSVGRSLGGRSAGGLAGGEGGLQDLSGDRSGGGAAEPCADEHDGDGDLGVLGGRERDEPGVGVFGVAGVWA